MNVYEIEIPALPGFTTIFAETLDAAIDIHQLFYEERFEEHCELFRPNEASMERREGDKALEDALRLNIAGVGSWDPVAGWIILEPELPAAGIIYRETRPVRCYELKVHSDDSERVLVFAADRRDAHRLFRCYRQMHEGDEAQTYSVRSVDPRSFDAEQQGLATAMKLGAIGIGSDLVGEWKILAPYDYAAGGI